MAELRVHVWQYGAALDPAANLAALDEVRAAATDADLVVLPEAFARDFGEPGSDLAPYAQPLDGPFVANLRALAHETGASWLGGMFEAGTDPERPFNTLVLAHGADRPGQVTTYRKIHLYDSFGYRESERVAAGPLAPVVTDVAGVPVGLMTCYDLRFPELARALAVAGAEVLVVPAAWVAGPRKLEHWRTLLRARAIENVCWVVAAAQPAPRYTGHSLVVAPTGDVVAEAGEGPEHLDFVLDTAAVGDARAANPSLANRRL